MNSILTSVKKVLGISEEYEHFDADIIMHINSVFSVLTQLGVGPRSGFFIEDKSSVWTDFISNDPRFSDIKTYMCLKVRLLFDPPLNSSVIEAMNRSINELEWRIHLEANPADEYSDNNEITKEDIDSLFGEHKETMDEITREDIDKLINDETVIPEDVNDLEITKEEIDNLF